MEKNAINKRHMPISIKAKRRTCGRGMVKDMEITQASSIPSRAEGGVGRQNKKEGGVSNGNKDGILIQLEGREVSRYCLPQGEDNSEKKRQLITNEARAGHV